MDIAVFNQNVKQLAFDKKQRDHMMSRYNFFMAVTEDCEKHYSNIELEKSRAYNIRNKAFKNYDKLLVDFETNIVSNGAVVRWACSAEEAKQMVYDILNDEKSKNVLTTKSLVAEEVGLIPYLEMKKINTTETDTGDFICYQFNERSSDSIHSAAHKTCKEVANVYTEKFGVKENLNAKQLMTVTRKVLNDKYLKADTAITGADFIVADTGDVILSENDGNVLKAVSRADVHIVLAGIDQLIPSVEDINVLLPLASLYEVMKVRAKSLYTILSKPGKKAGKQKKLYIVLVDNNRTVLMEKEVQRQILTCIKCGACHSVCPVFNTIGGHVYDNAVPGPVGVILSIKDNKENAALLSTLCATCHQCEQYCPMNIKISDLILHNRCDILKEDKSLISERGLYNFLMKKVGNRKDMNKSKDFFSKLEFKQLMKKSWGIHREIPKFAEKSFSELWCEIHGIE